MFLGKLLTSQPVLPGVSSDFVYAHMDAFENGDFIVTFIYYGDPSNRGIYGQVFDSSGLAKGENILVAPMPGGNAVGNPTVEGNHTVSATGNLINVAFLSDAPSSGDIQTVYLAQYRTDGTLVQYTTVPPGTYPGVFLFGVANGSTLVARKSAETLFDAYIYDSEFQFGILRADGSFTGFNGAIDGRIGTESSKKAIALDDNNSVVLNYSMQGMIKANLIDEDGLLLRSVDVNEAVTLNPSNGIDTYYAASSIAALPSGGFVVAWHTIGPNLGRVYFRTFDANGTPKGNAIQANDIHFLTDMQIVAVDAERIVIAWHASSDVRVLMMRLDGTVISSDSYDYSGLAANILNLTGGKLVIGGGKNIFHIYDTTKFEGTDNSDTWIGGSLIDTIKGFGGDDILIGGGGGDFIDGGDGRDTASFKFESGTTVSLDGSLVGTGAALGDTFISIENLIGSETGDDTLAGDAGNNTINGSGGRNTLFGRGGNDRFIGTDGINAFHGEDGIDAVTYEDTKGVRASLADSSLNAGDSVGDTYVSIENLTGSTLGGDSLEGDAQKNLLTGLGGDDYLMGRQNADIIDGGDGDDTAGYWFATKGITAALDKSVKFKGEAKGDTLLNIENLDGSKTGDDTLIGNKKANTLWGNGGTDKLYGQAGGDYLYGGKGADLLDGGKGEDAANYFGATFVHAALDGSFANKGEAKGDSYKSIENIFGSVGNDKLSGDGEDNDVFGNSGDDQLYGRSGDDVLEGGRGADVLTSGSGYDIFYFHRLANGGDTITDLKRKEDVVGLGSENFTNLDKKFLKKKFFVSHDSNKSADADDFVIFRKSDKTLWYDGDAKGTELEPVLIAKINVSITHEDIYIF
jgi:Ca2+-binding RTX toxin-like protein